MISSSERSEREADRVRMHTDRAVNDRIDRESEWSVQHVTAGGADAIQERLEELDREWDVERYLEANAAAIAFTGVVLAATRSRNWLVLPGIVTMFLFQHAVQGWCPPLALFRRMGVRTRKEIDREKYALKALRGDFQETVDAANALEAATT